MTTLGYYLHDTLAVLLSLDYRETRQIRDESVAFILMRDDDGLEKGVVEHWSDSR